MRKFLLVFTMFSIVVSITASLAHAHIDVDTSSEISFSIDLDDSDETTLLNSIDCDLACGGGCVHHVMNGSDNINDLTWLIKDKRHTSNTVIFVSDAIYGLKRPPKA